MSPPLSLNRESKEPKQHQPSPTTGSKEPSTTADTATRLITSSVLSSRSAELLTSYNKWYKTSSSSPTSIEKIRLQRREKWYGIRTTNTNTTTNNNTTNSSTTTSNNNEKKVVKKKKENNPTLNNIFTKNIEECYPPIPFTRNDDEDSEGEYKRSTNVVPILPHPSFPILPSHLNPSQSTKKQIKKKPNPH